MFVYWILFLIPAFAALTTGTRFKRDRAGRVRMTPAWLVMLLLLILLIGFRHQVGGDWFNYMRHLEEARGATIGYVFEGNDPGYRFLNWLATQTGMGIYAVNTIGAVIFCLGLLAFCRSMPRPWLALAAAIPYLVIVVAMGYTRQGIALGLAMFGLLALERHATTRFGWWVLSGATFHRSAVLLLPVAALAATRRRIWVAFWMGMVALVGYLAFVEQDVDVLYANYITRGYESQGALIRLGMNAVAALFFLALQARFEVSQTSRSLWRWISILALSMFAAFFVMPGSSTALDRLGLYLLPLQVLVFSHLPSVIGTRRTRKSWVVAVLLYFATIQAVWLLYANNAYAWLPYGNLLLGDG